MDGAPATIAITGAAGFIGGALARRLAADGHHVVGVDVRAPADDVASTSWVRGDVTDPASLAAAFAGADRIVHTAALVSDWGAMEDFVAVNVRGTRNVLDAAAGRRTVCLASVAVWGYEFRDDLPEDAAPRPCGIPYVDTKGAGERLALRRGATVIRPGDVYGPGSVPWIVRPLEALRGGTFRLPGRGAGIMTPVYVDDLVDAVVRALHTDRAAGRAYTVWDGRPLPAREFFAHHARMLGRDAVPTVPRPLA
ncbi:MAG TPA: NAD(P)-dependent oxidoreductase, partial [Solirubrobacteraceae bacterium]